MLLPVPFCKTLYTIPNEALTDSLTANDDETPVVNCSTFPILILELLFGIKAGVADNPVFKILRIMPNDELTLEVSGDAVVIG